jgi:hypothetical protein
MALSSRGSRCLSSFRTGAADAVIAIVVAVAVFLLIVVSSVDVLSAVPANVYGYAATVGYTLHAQARENLTAAGFANPLVLLIVSLVIGAIFGWVSGAVAKATTKSA